MTPLAPRLISSPSSRTALGLLTSLTLLVEDWPPPTVPVYLSLKLPVPDVKLHLASVSTLSGGKGGRNHDDA
jgi:hypothetical protein